MATINTIKIRRSASTASPSTIVAGELAYSESSKKLFYGQIAGSNALEIIGGSLYTNMLDHTVGTLTASSAILVDSDSKIDNLLVDNLQLNGSTIQTTNTNGDLTINTNGSGDILFTAATMSTAAQATEFLILDNSATSLVIKEGTTAYMSFVTTNGSENILVAKPMEFDGTTQFDGAMTVNGTTTYSGAINFANEAMTNVDINSGAIDGTTIGAASATTGAFTNLTASGTLGVTGVATFATHAVFGDSDIIKLGAGTDLQIYHDGTNSYVANATGALKVATETSGIAVTIGHTTSETTIADNASITGDLGVSGATTVAAITASGTATLNGNVVFGDNSGDTQTTTGVTTHTGQYNIDNLRLDGNALTSTDTNGNISISPHGSGTVDVGTSRITSVTDPTGAQDAATKAYVDAVKSGFDPKDSVVVATTADDTGLTYSNGSSGVGATLTNDGNEVYAIDGVNLTADMRVLVKDQSPATENGIYYVSTAGAADATLVLTRSTDGDTASELSSGAFVFVEQGSTNADAAFVMTQDTAITFGSTTVTWTQFSGAGQITAGDALTKSGNTLHWADDNITLEVSSDTARIKGITATAVGDLMIGAASNAGFTSLAKAAANNSFLTMGTSGSASWTTTIDGGTF
jgi:hypothetical protein|tara:strand:+ start:929 stop:2842 length:1914 start_codon:yes stop_codon:yes gene_type:complete